MDLLPENIVNLAAATIDPIHLEENKKGVSLDVLRLDKIDPVISGNKWFKLKYYLTAATGSNNKRVMTFGGAWSNHIAATACAAKKTGLQSVGIIRGEVPATLSQTLQQAAAQGMQLVFTSREQYNQKNDPAFIEKLCNEYDRPLIIPAGGEGTAGVKGASEIMNLVPNNNYSHIICATGTGTQLAGIVKVTSKEQQVLAVPVLKGFDNWEPPFVQKTDLQRIYVLDGYHMGGYAKKNDLLLNFMNWFYNRTGIPTDWVYTGKLFFAVTDLLKKDYFPPGSRILVIHSGGLQGNKSLRPGELNF